MAWKGFVKRNIRWLLGVFAWVIAARYFEQLWDLFGGLIFHLPTPPVDTMFWALISIGTIIVGSALILSDVQSRIKSKRQLIELEVGWHLSGDVQPVPPFGSQDIPGSDKASKLHFSQRGKTLTLKGDMRGLKSSYMYHVQLAKPYTPLKLAKDTIIGAEKAPYANFTTDENGTGT